MKSPPSEFKLVYRNCRDAIVLIPGWATDYRIFNTVDLDFNYIMPIVFSPFQFEEELVSFLVKNGLNKVSLLGWSMGGFAACDFVSRYQDRIDMCILMGMRVRYERGDIEKIKTYLRRSREGFLYKFYNDCFSSNEKETLAWFKRNLLRTYLDQMNLDVLSEGLDYLLTAQLRLQSLCGVKIKLIHGQEDKIAPFEEANSIMDGLPQAAFRSIPHGGHIPFLLRGFREIFYETDNE